MKTHTLNNIGKEGKRVEMVQFRSGRQFAAESAFNAVTIARDNPLTHKKRTRVTRMLPK